MAVKLMKGGLKPSKVKKTKTKTKAKSFKKDRDKKRPLDLSTLTLPTERNEPERDIRRYSFLLYGREGIGKTTYLSTFPGMLFITAEPGAKGLRIYEWNKANGGTTSWPIFLKAVELLEKNPGKFKNIAIDTVDRLHQMCSDYIVEEVMKIPRVGLTQQGEKDYGASYQAINREFTRTLDRITRAGIGVVLTSHVTENEIKKRDGSVYHQFSCTLSKSPKKAIEGYVDFIFFADYAKDTNGKPRRVIITEGDEIIVAKNRKIGDRHLPTYLEMVEEGGYQMLKDAFKGTYKGLNPKTLLPSKRSTKAAAGAITDNRVRTITKGG